MLVYPSGGEYGAGVLSDPCRATGVPTSSLAVYSPSGGAPVGGGAAPVSSPTVGSTSAAVSSAGGGGVGDRGASGVRYGGTDSPLGGTFGCASSSPSSSSLRVIASLRSGTATTGSGAVAAAWATAPGRPSTPGMKRACAGT